MHPTVLHEDSRLVSSDFPHYTRQVLETEWPQAVVVYQTGPCGNLSPRYHVRAQTFAEAKRLGARLGEQILAAVRGVPDAAFRPDAAVGAGQRALSLPPRTFGSVAEAERELAAARAEFRRLQAEGAPHGPVRTAECTVFGAEERVTLARAEAAGRTATLLKEYNPMTIQALRLGETVLFGLPGEWFVEFGLSLKQRVPGCRVAALANGELQGYIPTPEATGYEARLSFFEPRSGALMVEAATALAAELCDPA
jgi:hypothetical protein